MIVGSTILTLSPCLFTNFDTQEGLSSIDWLFFKNDFPLWVQIISSLVLYGHIVNIQHAQFVTR